MKKSSLASCSSATLVYVISEWKTRRQSLSGYVFPLFIFLLVLSSAPALLAQVNHPDESVFLRQQETHAECITEEQRAAVLEDVEDNVAMLHTLGLLTDETEMLVSLGWPLRLKPGLTDPSYYYINNYVDESPEGGVLDYYCGNRTYNGHRGTDVDIWPFPWNKMANNAVEVIAAASGVIVAKYDGNYDQQCALNASDWNGFIVQHSDGSRAWYVHLKKFSLNAKGVGATVAKGEYLGVVGSSGNSTGPHLHFELTNSSNQLVDPWGGNCNYLGGQSWWAPQKPYYDPYIVKIMTHNNAPQMSQCPAGEAVNASNTFIPGQVAYFASYFRDRTPGQTAYYSIKRPNGTVWQSWSQNPSISGVFENYWWYWWFTLPTDAPQGNWTFTVTLNAQTVTHVFSVTNPCNAPTTSQIFANNITTSGARLNCSVAGVSGYDWRYQVTGATTWTDVNWTTTNYINLTGLLPGTGYTYQVAVKCGNTWSAWSPSAYFTTQSAGSGNNEPCGASTLAINSSCVYSTFNTTGATATTNPSTAGIACPVGGIKDIWIKFTMPSTGKAVFTTQPGSLTDAVVAAYSGATCSALTYIGCIDDNPNGDLMPDFYVTGTAGAVHWLRIWGYNGATGTFTICGVVGTNFQGDGDQENAIAADAQSADRADATEKMALKQEYAPSVLSIYPVPATDQITLALDLREDAMPDIRIFDLDGQPVREIPATPAASGTFRKTVNISELPNGTYFVKVRAGEQDWNGRFVKVE